MNGVVSTDTNGEISRRWGAESALKILFLLILALRFCLPFEHNPFDHLTSDSFTHWNAGAQLFYPNLFTGTLPKLYKLYIFVIRHLTQDNRLLITTLTGLLCASMPWFWYRGLGEVLSEKGALFVASLIGLSPSLTVIYGYFMTETLLFNLLGLAFWMSLRASRIKTCKSYCAALLSWELAILTRPAVALPAVLFLAYLLLSSEKKLRLMVYTGVISLLLFLPAACESYAGTGMFVPIPASYPAQIYKYSGALEYGYQGPRGGRAAFASGNFFVNPLEPFLDFKTYRTGKKMVSIDPKNGDLDWKRALQELKKRYTRDMFWRDLYENNIFLFFGQSWPDSDKNDGFWLKRANYYFRWTFAPTLLTPLLGSLWVPYRKEEALIVLITLAMTLALMTQQMSVLEGRYRKPLEPFLLVSVVIILKNAWFSQDARPGRKNLFSFLHESLNLRRRESGPIPVSD